MQQINLYQDALRPAREYLALAQLGRFLGWLVLGLVVVNTGQVIITWRANQQLGILQTEQTQLQTQVSQLQQQLQARAAENNAAVLQNQMTQLDMQLQNKQQVVQLLTGRHIGNVKGFATQFGGLARQHIDGLWLTGLYIHDGGEKLNLRGSTSSPDLLPKYLQRLALEPSFQGIEFKTFLMQRAKDRAQVDFDLRSTPEEKGK